VLSKIDLAVRGTHRVVITSTLSLSIPRDMQAANDSVDGNEVERKKFQICTVSIDKYLT
jgi:hypothetical protein